MYIDSKILNQSKYLSVCADVFTVFTIRAWSGFADIVYN